MKKAAYRLLLLSRIPVSKSGEELRTLDLWARDLAAQAGAVDTVTLVAPITSARALDIPLPAGIRVVPLPMAMNDPVHLVSAHDVVQINGGAPWWRSRAEFRLARAARAAGRLTVLGVSSDRARTTLMNAEEESLPRRIKARVVAAGISRATSRLAREADAVFVIGEGLRALNLPNSEVQVETASWIRRDEILSSELLARRADAAGGASSLRLGVASRLERMKGVHLAIEALGRLRRAPASRQASLSILGDGPERPELERAIHREGLSDVASFAGTFAYPQPFLSELGKLDALLITNRNVEQPRVLFDALSQGVLPVCPDLPPYRALGLPDSLFYTAGDAAALASAIDRLAGPVFREALLAAAPIARSRTIETMHEARAAWISGLLTRRR